MSINIDFEKVVTLLENLHEGCEKAGSCDTVDLAGRFVERPAFMEFLKSHAQFHVDALKETGRTSFNEADMREAFGKAVAVALAEGIIVGRKLVKLTEAH